MTLLLRVLYWFWVCICLITSVASFWTYSWERGTMLLLFMYWLLNPLRWLKFPLLMVFMLLCMVFILLFMLLPLFMLLAMVSNRLTTYLSCSWAPFSRPLTTLYGFL